MKTQIITVLAAAVLVGAPAYGYSDRNNNKETKTVHAAAVSHSSRPYTAVRGGNRNFTATRAGSTHVTTGRSFASNGRQVNHHQFVSNRSRSNIAFGGNSNPVVAGHRNYTYAFASHPGWNQGHEYYWHGHHYRWFNNGWFIIDPFAVGYPYAWNYGYRYYGPPSGRVAVDVQQQLAREGYYNGPIDGIVGPGTHAAIADYQHDAGLPVTGSINPPLLNSLGVE